MGAWFKPDFATAHESIFSIQHYGGGAGGDNHALKVRGDLTGNPVTAHSYQTGETPAWAESTTGITAGEWHYALGVWAATDDRRVYLDGGSKGTDSADWTCPGINAISIAASKRDGGDDRYFTGAAAHAAFWSCILTDLDAWLLFQGAHPAEIRPECLQGYWALGAQTGEANRGLVSIALTRWFGHTVVPGPTVARSLWSAQDILRLPVSPTGNGDGSTIPVIYHHLKQQGIG